jgi:cytochrome c biogenesis protein
LVPATDGPDTVPSTGSAPGPRTVHVELGGLARTDNSGWGDEFERLTHRLLDGLDTAEPSREKV